MITGSQWSSYFGCPEVAFCWSHTVHTDLEFRLGVLESAEGWLWMLGVWELELLAWLRVGQSSQVGRRMDFDFEYLDCRAKILAFGRQGDVV